MDRQMDPVITHHLDGLALTQRDILALGQLGVLSLRQGTFLLEQELSGVSDVVSGKCLAPVPGLVDDLRCPHHPIQQGCQRFSA